MALSSTFRSRNCCSMAEFRVGCLTYTHSLARPVPSLTLAGYGLPPTVTIPARRLIKSKRLSRLEPRTFLTVTRALTTRSPTLYRLSYATGLSCHNLLFAVFSIWLWVLVFKLWGPFNASPTKVKLSPGPVAHSVERWTPNSFTRVLVAIGKTRDAESW